MNNNSVSMEAVENFVRQLGHDWRNSLNCIDLLLSGLHHVEDEAEKSAEIEDAHQLIQKTARQLASVSRRLSNCKPQLISYPARFLIEDLQERFKKSFEAQAERFAWQSELGEEKVSIDFEAVASALEELFTNALTFTPQQKTFPVLANLDDRHFSITLSESKTEDPHVDRWSEGTAFKSSLRGRYGLGIYHLRQVFEAHRGTVEFSFSETSLLITKMRLPLAHE